MQLSPIVLFVYNRAWHTQQTVDSLKKNELADQSELFVFSDGARNSGEEQKVNDVRKYLRSVNGFKSVTIVERSKNYGLASSIISGVTELVNRFGRVIVLEDDLVTSRYFLRYMNDALEKYRDDDKVISAHAYVYPVKNKLPETFFLKGADCWGWATWKRGWDLFEPDGRKLLLGLKKKKLTRRFNYHGAYPYLEMLSGQIEGENDSWAIRWYASALMNNKLTLYPGRPLVENIGIDNSGTHCGNTQVFDTVVASSPVRVDEVAVVEQEEALYAFEGYFRSLRLPFITRCLQFLKDRFKGQGRTTGKGFRADL